MFLKRSGYLCLLILISATRLCGQSSGLTDFDLWAQRMNWDGITPWKYLLTISPGFMGPNALPVPILQQGRIDSSFFVELRPEYHHSSGDQTYDLYGRVYVPLVQNKIAIEGYMVFYERYNMDRETLIARSARTPDGKGSAVGDVYLTAIFQLLQENPKRPGIALDVTLKTASGGALLDARYNDAAGYYFNLSSGKNLCLNEEKGHFLRLHAMLGFYVWQIYTENLQQNDALSYGLGAALRFRQWSITQSISGYQGYLDNGDHPVTYQIDVNTRLKMLGYGFGYTAGIRDFPYHSFRFSTFFYIR